MLQESRRTKGPILEISNQSKHPMGIIAVSDRKASGIGTDSGHIGGSTLKQVPRGSMPFSHQRRIAL
jgi:hypothetical protein